VHAPSLKIVRATRRNDDRSRRIWESSHSAGSIPDSAQEAFHASGAEARRRPEHQRGGLLTLSSSSLAPHVFSRWNRTENPISIAARIEDRHVENEHWFMPPPVFAKPHSRFRFLLILGMHCDYFLSLGRSRLVANSANTSAQKIDMGIMAGLSNGPHSRLAPTASARRLSATFELRIRKVFPARDPATRRRALAHVSVRHSRTKVAIVKSDPFPHLIWSA
jgi:hypothetical protein